MSDYRRLRVWALAHEATLQVYRLTAAFPASERFGLTSQLRRAAVSVAANIAEGCGRRAPGDKRRFFEIAAGSMAELSYLLRLCLDLGYAGRDAVDSLLVKADASAMMIAGLLKSAPLRTANSEQRTAPFRR